MPYVYVCTHTHSLSLGNTTEESPNTDIPGKTQNASLKMEEILPNLGSLTRSLKPILRKDSNNIPNASAVCRGGLGWSFTGRVRECRNFSDLDPSCCDIIQGSLRV